MIEGEPGIGKTRLAEELITYARVRGALVLSAACHEADAMPAYYPFSQAIRAYIREADPVGLAWQLGSDGPELARLIPELTEIVPSVSEPEPLSGEESRFRFYDAVAGFLIGISRLAPARARLRRPALGRLLLDRAAQLPRRPRLRQPASCSPAPTARTRRRRGPRCSG